MPSCVLLHGGGSWGYNQSFLRFSVCPVPSAVLRQHWLNECMEDHPFVLLLDDSDFSFSGSPWSHFCSAAPSTLPQPHGAGTPVALCNCLFLCASAPPTLGALEGRARWDLAFGPCLGHGGYTARVSVIGPLPDCRASPYTQNTGLQQKKEV